MDSEDIQGGKNLWLFLFVLITRTDVTNGQGRHTGFLALLICYREHNYEIICLSSRYFNCTRL